MRELIIILYTAVEFKMMNTNHLQLSVVNHLQIYWHIMLICYECLSVSCAVIQCMHFLQPRKINFEVVMGNSNALELVLAQPRVSQDIRCGISCLRRHALSKELVHCSIGNMVNFPTLKNSLQSLSLNLTKPFVRH